MRDKQLCADIGKRIKQRRKELNLSLGYIADKMGVNISTAQRYEAGLIDNSKKIVVDSLAEILHTTPEWLRGETSDLNSDVKDYMELKLIDSSFYIIYKEDFIICKSQIYNSIDQTR